MKNFGRFLKMPYVGYTLYLAIVLIYIALFGPEIRDDRIRVAGLNTQGRLTRFHEALDFIHQNCGRYPSTEEGIPAIHQRLPNMSCLNQQMKTDVKWEFKNITETDGNGETLTYSSDGAHYLIKASRGYFLTDSSPVKNSQYWENPAGGSPFPTFRKPFSDRVIVSFWVLVLIFGGIFFFPINQFSKTLGRARRAFAYFTFALYLVSFILFSLVSFVLYIGQF